MDEVDDVEDADCSSGASHASMLVVESNCMGAEIVPRLREPPEENLDRLFRDGLGADDSSRRERCVKTLVRLAMMAINYDTPQLVFCLLSGCRVDGKY